MEQRYVGRADVLTVTYESLRADKDRVMREVCDFVGLPFDAAVLEDAYRATSRPTADQRAAERREVVEALTLIRGCFMPKAGLGGEVRYLRSLSVVQGTAVNIMRTAVLLLMLVLIVRQQITIGQFVALFFYSFYVFGPLQANFVDSETIVTLGMGNAGADWTSDENLAALTQLADWGSSGALGDSPNGLAYDDAWPLYTEGTGVIPDDKIAEIVTEVFDLRPKGIIQMLDLLRPIYQKTAAYGHFGRSEPEFTWEKTDKAEVLAAEAGVKRAANA